MQNTRLVGKGVRQLVGTSGVAMYAVYSKGNVFTRWDPSPEEYKMLLAGKPVWLVQRGTMIPEQLLMVGDEEEVMPSHARREMMAPSFEDAERDQAVQQAQEIKKKADKLAWIAVAALYALTAVVVVKLAWWLFH